MGSNLNLLTIAYICTYYIFGLLKIINKCINVGISFYSFKTGVNFCIIYHKLKIQQKFLRSSHLNVP